MKNITIKKGTFREEVYNEYHEAKEEGREGIRISDKSGNVPDIFIWNKEELVNKSIKDGQLNSIGSEPKKNNQ